MKLRVLAVCCVLAACAPERPEGAYTPPEGPTIDRSKFGETGDEDAGEEPEPVDPEVSEPDPNEPTVPVDPDGPAIVGSYLMRLDSYSSAEFSEGSNMLTVKNRISNLMLTKITYEDGKYVSYEQLCHQTYAHACVTGCDRWETSVYNDLPKLFFPKVNYSRELQVDDSGRLIAPQATFLLGFTVDAPGPSTALPGSVGEASVWKLAPASSAKPDPNLAGMYTQIVADLKATSPIPYAERLTCMVGTVQRISTAFQTDVDVTQADALEGRDIVVDSTGSDAASIYAAPLSSGVTAQYCSREQLGKGSGKADVQVVRFKRTSIVNCPEKSSAFEASFPADVLPPRL